MRRRRSPTATPTTTTWLTSTTLPWAVQIHFPPKVKIQFLAFTRTQMSKTTTEFNFLFLFTFFSTGADNNGGYPGWRVHDHSTHGSTSPPLYVDSLGGQTCERPTTVLVHCQDILLKCRHYYFTLWLVKCNSPFFRIFRRLLKIKITPCPLHLLPQMSRWRHHLMKSLCTCEVNESLFHNTHHTTILISIWHRYHFWFCTQNIVNGKGKPDSCVLLPK